METAFIRFERTARVKVEFNRAACAGWFQCVQEWDAFDMNMMAGKADLTDCEEVDDDVFVRDVPEDQQAAAKRAAECCPVDAIRVYVDGEQVVPQD